MRGGAVLEQPAAGLVDSIDKVRLVSGVIPALLRLQSAGYEIVLIAHEPGLGSAALPRAAFDSVDSYLRELLASQGVRIAAVFVCPHTVDENCGCRPPGIGLVRDFLASPPVDRERSFAVGHDETALELARNLGVAGYKLGEGTGWPAVTHAIVDRPRTAVVARRTKETDIRVRVDLDREADAKASTGLGFFDHMLEQLGKHGAFELEASCTGDLHIDEHHTVEDVALALGQALREALGDKRGIQRYGFLLPMDEADAEVSVDLGGRPFLVFEANFPRDRVGDLPTELVPHFFRSLAETLGAAIHVRVRGENAHHMVEVTFKGVARALRQAFARQGDELPTTKGLL
jgi:imidazoleglycerol-phosphate dehydratase/histidinol-phosphatase